MDTNYLSNYLMILGLQSEGDLKFPGLREEFTFAGADFSRGSWPPEPRWKRREQNLSQETILWPINSLINLACDGSLLFGRRGIGL